MIIPCIKATVENRENEITQITKQLECLNSELEKSKRKLEGASRDKDQLRLHCQNQIAMQKNQFERQLNESNVELEKWQSQETVVYLKNEPSLKQESPIRDELEPRIRNRIY